MKPLRKMLQEAFDFNKLLDAQPQDFHNEAFHNIINAAHEHLAAEAHWNHANDYDIAGNGGLSRKHSDIALKHEKQMNDYMATAEKLHADRGGKRDDKEWKSMSTKAWKIAIQARKTIPLS